VLRFACTYKFEGTKRVYLKVRLFPNVDWLQLVQERIHCRAVVSALVNFPKPSKEDKCLSN